MGAGNKSDSFILHMKGSALVYHDTQDITAELNIIKIEWENSICYSFLVKYWPIEIL